MYSKIPVLLDGSQLPEQIILFARWLADGFRIAVELLHLTDPDAPRFLAAASGSEIFSISSDDRIDGGKSTHVEEEKDIAWRKDLLRKIEYKI